MIRNLLAVLVLCAAASGSVTVHAVLTDGTGTVSKTAFLRFQLENCGANIPSARVPGKAAIQTNFDLRPNQVDGSILYTTLFGNDEIQCGGVFSTYWFVTVMKDQTHPLRDGLSYVLLSGTTFDPAVTPVMSVQQPAPAPPPLCCVSPLQGGSPGSNPGGGPVTFQLPCPTNVVVGANGYSTGNGGFNCDPFFIDDGVGNWTSQSGRTVGPVNGFLGLIGGSASPGSAVKYKLGLNEFRFLARTGTSEYVVPPATLCGTSQVWGVLSTVTDGNGDSVQLMQCQNSGTGVEAQVGGVDNANCVAGVCPLIDLVAGANVTVVNTSGGHVRIAAGAGTEVQVNGVDTTAQTPINFRNTPTITCTNPSLGNIDCNATGSSTPQIGTPVAPTLTTNGTPASTSITYKIVGCQDGATCAYHTAASGATTIATAAATLTSVNSVNVKTYGDTLYGPRCYNVYRTAAGGTPSTIGLIANCVWKSFIDTGQAGDGTTAPVTNTTTLDANGATAPLPGCSKTWAAPWGIDGPPCSPNAMDDEFTSTFGAPGDVNSPFWTWLNQNSATATLSNGLLELAAPTRGGSDNLNCLLQAVPGSTPYSFVAIWYDNWTTTTSHVNTPAIGFYEASSGKLQTAAINGSSTNHRLFMINWTNTTTETAFPYIGDNNLFPPNPIYFKVQNDGANLAYYYSPDGVLYTQIYSVVKNNWFTTGPSSVALCVDANTGAFSMDIDFFRRVQ